MEFPDPALAQQVLDFRAHHMLRNGTLAGQMTDLFVRAGFEGVSIEEMVLVVRDPGAVDNVMGCAPGLASPKTSGGLRDEEVRRWEALYDAVVADVDFSGQSPFSSRLPGSLPSKTIATDPLKSCCISKCVQPSQLVMKCGSKWRHS
jgi:hypothetical protein